MQLELNSNSQIEFKYIELKRNMIQIDAKGIEQMYSRLWCWEKNY